ncbi:unnamed protein product [Pleuronectes platessa]|uniref:Uncharacterized protein n=1 Tax=Pleuronectes platessa TaxID=8262 RepID=A0A9N7V541_PLEPL|nr:unnamed protein product [Pleuronectes platessa]
MDWMDPLPRKRKETEEDKERASDGRVPLSHCTDNVSLLRPRRSYAYQNVVRALKSSQLIGVTKPDFKVFQAGACCSLRFLQIPPRLSGRSGPCAPLSALPE